MKALLFAAGLGTRLQPFTLQHPKALAMVNGKSLLERNVAYLQQHGINEVIVNVHHFAGQIIDAINVNKGWGSNITISDETDMVLETGGGLKKAAWYLENETDFVVMNVDMLTDMPLTDMILQHQSEKPLATLAVTDRVSTRYFLFNKENQLCGWRNTSTQEERGPVLGYSQNGKDELKQRAFSGIHVINSSVLSLITQEGKFSLVDVYMGLCVNNYIKGFYHLDNKLIDVGKPESILKAEALFD